MCCRRTKELFAASEYVHRLLSSSSALLPICVQGHINQMLAANSLLFSCSQDCSIRVWGMEGEAFVCRVSQARGGGKRWAFMVGCLVPIMRAVRVKGTCGVGFRQRRQQYVRML